MIGRRRQKERTQLFQITAIFLGAGRAELKRGRLDAGACSPGTARRDPAGGAPGLSPRLPSPHSASPQKREEKLLSPSPCHSGEKSRARFPDGGHQVLERARPKWRELPCSHGASGGKGSRDCPGEQAGPGHAGERRKCHKAEDCKEPNPHAAPMRSQWLLEPRLSPDFR